MSHHLPVLLLAVLAALPAKAEWIVGFEGAGPVKIGMPLAQVNRALGEHFAAPVIPEADPTGRCFQVSPSSVKGVALMINDGILVRIDVYETGLHTSAGVSVGDATSKVLRSYRMRTKSEPHAYVPGGLYLTVQARGGSNGLRFEIVDGKVAGYYVGTLQAIQYIEGCA